MLSHVNVGSGTDCTIKQLTQTIAEVVGYSGVIEWDASKPDGAPRKLMNVDKIKQLGWSPTVNLVDGLKKTYAAFLSSVI